MRIDVNTFIGTYPYRDIGGWDAARLIDELDRLGIDEAWVSHLSAIFWRDPTAGNAELYRMSETNPRLKAIPAIHPGLPRWEAMLDEAMAQHVPCVRTDPTFHGLPPAGAEMRNLVAACAERRVALVVAVRLEDGRQRHPHDGATDLPASAVRTLIRSAHDARLIVIHADRDFVEQVHFGSTPDEASRLLWDICWIWGPPEDHLATLLDTVGTDRFAFGTGTPLRLGETSLAKLDLLNLDPAVRAMIESENLQQFCRARPASRG